MLSMVRRVFFGPLTNPDNESLEDLTPREVTVLLPLVALIFIIGFFPRGFTEPMSASVATLVEGPAARVELARDPRARAAAEELQRRRAERPVPQPPGAPASAPSAPSEGKAPTFDMPVALTQLAPAQPLPSAE
jgi:hypothetical protein